MVPDFQMIMKVKLCSVGYEQFEMLSQKFFVLYNTSKEQLSAQKHYDWGALVCCVVSCTALYSTVKYSVSLYCVVLPIHINHLFIFCSFFSSNV
jgi:hypothetical protein